MAIEIRPADCRERLRAEGKPRPRSGCSACKLSLQPCPYAPHDYQPAAAFDAPTLPSGGSSGVKPPSTRGTWVAESEAKIRLYDTVTALLTVLTPTIIKIANAIEKDIDSDEGS